MHISRLYAFVFRSQFGLGRGEFQAKILSGNIYFACIQRV